MWPLGLFTSLYDVSQDGESTFSEIAQMGHDVMLA